MRVLNRLRAIAVVVAKRITSQPWLMFATVLGLVIAIALMMSIPLYADAVYHRIFLENINTDNGVVSTTSDGIPPFTYLFRYDGSIHGSVEWEDVQAVDTYFREEAGKELGLPQRGVVHYFSTDPFGIYADAESAFSTTTTPLTWAGFGYISDVQEHIVVQEGAFPAPATAGVDSAVEVLIHNELATELGLQVGEEYIAFIKVRGNEGLVKSYQIPVRISGVWQAEDSADSFWFFKPRSFSERMLVPKATFADYLAPALEEEVYTAVWYLVLDGADIHHNDAGPMIRRTLSVERHAESLLEDTSLAKSPLEALVDYRRSANLLTILLYAFSIPIMGLLLAFITLTSGLAVERRRNEIAVLRSRGAMALQMLGIAAVESLLLGGLALLLSSPAGMAVAGLISRARSFLNFTTDVEALRISLTMNTLRFGFLGVVLATLAQILPTFSASGHTVVSYKREQARMLRPPWWQRSWLDILLLFPAGYGAYVLRQQGSLVVLAERFGNAPLQNPLLFLVPALGIFALTLFFLRLMPMLMSAVAWIASHTRAVGLLMAARHLARTPGFYSTPLILLVLTLSLSAFTASLAYTLDAHLYDQTYYQAGADVQFLEMGEGAQTMGLGAYFGGDGGGDEAEEESGPRWLFLPVSEYTKVEGVEAAMRVGRYPAVSRLTSGNETGVFIGVDRATFPRISFWRDDFSSQSLGSLMNALASERNGVLVPQEFLQNHVLLVGDEIPVTVVTYGQRNEMRMRIVGTFEYFPTWYPSEGPLFVGHLEYLFEEAGGQFPYGIWLSVTPEADMDWLLEEGLDVRGFNWSAPPLAIAEEQRLPERQGLFGLLSVGFAAAAVLTVLGFLLYALFSFRRRFIEFGVLRAVGLSARQMTAFLAWELAFLILMGGGLGTLLGSGVSSFFIPFLQVGVDEVTRIPPYVVDIAWPAIFRIYVLFGLLFVVALIALILMLRRMKIFEAVKLGETA